MQLIMTVDYDYIDAVWLLMIYNLDFVDFFIWIYVLYIFRNISCECNCKYFWENNTLECQNSSSNLWLVSCHAIKFNAYRKSIGAWPIRLSYLICNVHIHFTYCHLDTKQQAIAWTNIEPVTWWRMASASELIFSLWWRHQMKTFPRYWKFVRGIQRSPVNSPHKGQWRGTLMFSLICAWTNAWVNNREAGDLRRHRANYNVIVMIRILVADKKKEMKVILSVKKEHFELFTSH